MRESCAPFCKFPSVVSSAEGVRYLGKYLHSPRAVHRNAL
uniref:Uncharacterized protein n=1 Tax=Anguilla anguilla TaxID=7936 RepID=A0A0E9XQU4_ANGAN